MIMEGTAESRNLQDVARHRKVAGLERRDRGHRTMTKEDKKSPWRAFLDFFVLFSGVSTASNLSRTQPRPVKQRGLFLFRKPSKDDSHNPPGKP
jgi:hypothetical protein